MKEMCSDHLSCPGLQDLTTDVDFTEIAVAGKELGAWKVLAYGPMLLLEISAMETHRGKRSLGHIVERAGQVDTELAKWYKPETQGGAPKSWKSFKVLVQYRGRHDVNWS